MAGEGIWQVTVLFTQRKQRIRTGGGEEYTVLLSAAKQRNPVTSANVRAH